MSMRILHCLRAPVGGLFRHVCDLARAQSGAGHLVGIICDNSTGGPLEENILDEMRPYCALGISRIAMARQLGPRDITALLQVRHIAIAQNIQVIHGHGAKGGAYARLVNGIFAHEHHAIKVFYTPHGGSLHYQPGTLKGAIFLGLERRLAKLTDGLIFESAYSAQTYQDKVAKPECDTRIIHNGLCQAEFTNHTTADDAVDFLFVGELRQLKGVDVLLDALAMVQGEVNHAAHSQTSPPAKPVRAMIVGAGPDAAEFQQRCQRLGLSNQVSFPGPMPAGQAFVKARCLVVPSRAESFPYVILEAAAARMPMLATYVGGIPEITKGTDYPLLPPGDAFALADAMTAFLNNPEIHLAQAALLQAKAGERFSVSKMAAAVESFYEHHCGRQMSSGKPVPAPDTHYPIGNLQNRDFSISRTAQD